MLFWIMTAALVALVGLLFVLALMRRKAGDEMSSAAYDVQVYRDQLREVEKDLARGVIPAEEAERARLEISRRMLEADRAAQQETESARAPKGATAAILVLIAAVMSGSFYLYQRLGAAGYPDQPFAERIAMADEIYQNRPSQDEAEKTAAAERPAQPEPDPQFLELMERLRQAVADRPNERQGLELLARNEAAIGNYRAGWEAQRRLIALEGENATADDYAALGELMVVAAGGLVTPEAESAFSGALERDPRNGLALYYIGLMMAQNARGDRAFRIWDSVLRQGPETAPWIPMIRQNIEELAWIAGERNYEQPAPVGLGPTLDDLLKAAQAPMPEAREMILREKLESLNSKMARQGGSAEDWALLIAALKLVGDAERMDALWGEAQTVFAERPAMLDIVRAAAEGDLNDLAAALGDTRALGAPDAEQMEAAADMTPEERQEMILGMVNGLVERLETEGGNAAEWSRAISSLATLGETGRAAEVYAKAQAALAGNEVALGAIAEAAAAAGIAR